MKFIENASKIYKMWSMQLSTVGAGIVTVATYFPSAYNELPVVVQGIIPPQYATGIGLGLIGLSWLARVIKQNNVSAGNVNK
jgi:hypothetical protein